MKWLCRFAARLYPAWWRRRYGIEFEALLDEVEPGWRQLFNVLNGAVTMQVKTLGAIPVLCALAGAVVGGVIAMRTPAVYASSATIRLTARDVGTSEPAAAQELRGSLEGALGTSRAATSVMMVARDSTQTTVRLTYQDRNPEEAHRGAERLTAAVATGNTQRVASAEVLDAPVLPTTPVGPDYPLAVAVGGGVGLVAGGFVLLVTSRRRAASRRPDMGA